MAFRVQWVKSPLLSHVTFSKLRLCDFFFELYLSGFVLLSVLVSQTIVRASVVDTSEVTDPPLVRCLHLAPWIVPPSVFCIGEACGISFFLSLYVLFFSRSTPEQSCVIDSVKEHPNVSWYVLLSSANTFLVVCVVERCGFNLKFNGFFLGLPWRWIGKYCCCLPCLSLQEVIVCALLFDAQKGTSSWWLRSAVRLLTFLWVPTLFEDCHDSACRIEIVPFLVSESSYHCQQSVARAWIGLESLWLETLCWFFEPLSSTHT